MDNIECPYCGYEIKDSWDYCEDGKGGTIECPDCGMSFDFDVEYDPNYSSWKNPCANGEPHKWDFGGLYPMVNHDNTYNIKCQVCGINKFCLSKQEALALGISEERITEIENKN